MMVGVEVTSDGNTVWINKWGGAIGRFGLNGIDVHTEDTAGCLYCTHEITTPADWTTFVEKMLEHHSVRVGDVHMPDRLR